MKDQEFKKVRKLDGYKDYSDYKPATLVQRISFVLGLVLIALAMGSVDFIYGWFQ